MISDEVLEGAARKLCRMEHVRRYGEPGHPYSLWREGELELKVNQYWPHYKGDALPIIEAAVEAERAACEQIAMSYDHKGSIRICDPETWQREMSPQDVYDTGVCDGAVGIATAIRNRKAREGEKG